MPYPLPTSIAAGDSGHIAHTTQQHKRYNFEGPKVKADFGAVGNSHHNNGGGTDDTAAIQNAIDAAHDQGIGRVFFEPGTYRITQPLKMYKAAGTGGAIRLTGLGMRNAAGTWGATLVWDGPTDGTPRAMLDYDTAGSNIGAAPIEDLRLTGRWIQNASAIHYRKPVDLGTYLRNLWFGSWHGDSIIYTGATNAFIYHCRWDSCVGYAVRLTFTAQNFFSMRDCTWVCDDQSGSPARGMFLAERSGTDVNACGFFNFHNINTEVHVAMAEEEAGGTDPADRRGIIHLLTNPSHTTTQQFVRFDNIKMDTTPGMASYSLFLARGGGTAAQRGRRLIITGNNLRGTNGNGTASTGHRIPLGNVASGMKAAAGDNFAVFEHKPQNTEIAANQRPISHVYTGTD